MTVSLERPPSCLPRRGFAGTFSALVLAVSGALCAADETREKETFFETEIRPVLATRCVSCHGLERQDGSTRLDSREGVARSQSDGQLLRTVRGRSTAPTACVLEPHLADAVERWVAMGMPWPEQSSVNATEDREAMARRHWAFQPLRDPVIPGHAATAIDAFIAERRDQAGLEASPEAERRTLARRLSYTLTGLPPSEEVLSQYLADPSPQAYARLVDRLLDSPHYGEHWARHWLDVARYSDTKGYVYGREEKRWPHAWTYRDWVVGALNEDLPYDRFLLLQLAADQLPDRRPGDEAAMGFLTIGRRFLGVKHDIIDDRIDVVTRGTLGLSVSCARCHDHKYDPIPAADYYSLHGVFDSSIETLVLLEDGDEAFRKAHLERVAKRNEAMAKRRAEAAERARGRLADYLKAQTELDRYPADGFDQIFQKTDLLPAFVHAWRDYLRAAEDRGDPIFLPWHAYAALGKEDFAKKAKELALDTARTHPLIARTFTTPPGSFDEVVSRYAGVLSEIEARWSASVAASSARGNVPPAGLPDLDEEALRRVLYAPGSPCVVPEGYIVDVESFFDSETLNELWKLDNQVTQAIISAPETVRAALLLTDRSLPVEPRILLRGNPLTQGEQVPRQFLGILAGVTREAFSSGSGRLELAQAIADPSNPLTARVIVNRVWAHHFGEGLVDTPSDFGTRAAPPSHPELLDWLANQFLREGWSLKSLHRHILTSATFRQSSQGPVDAAARRQAQALDPGNRLLWRMNSRRLGYEEFRDTMMAATGELDAALGGKPVEAFSAPYTTRRALYGKVDRQFVPGTLRVFDFANPDLHIPKRNETSVPQQALFFLNHPFVLDRARALAEKSADASGDPARVRALFRLALLRDPSREEVAEALALIDGVGELKLPQDPPSAADWTYGYGSLEEGKERVEGFAPLPHFTGAAWQGGANWPDAELGWVQLTAEGGHPGNDRSRAAVRRWTAPRAMKLAMRTKLVHEASQGDGIRAFVVSSRVGLLGSASVHAQSIDLSVASLAVEPGETIDFLVDIGDGLGYDQFLWEIQLADPQTDPENPALSWNAKSDFPVQRTARLTAWQQLAQTILCANEFHFVD